MLDILMHSINDNSKILLKIINYLDSIKTKVLLHLGLLLFWSVILIGTFKEFL
jgi:hypothetical protein